tara:strand:- start:633 stop:1079 length:447 start_codon:yes stop_codon:yes gene_type:complete
MTLYEVGRMCMKIAGRDAGRKCVVVEVVDDRFVVIDGDVRRKKVNIKHLEPLADKIEIKDKAAHADVKTAFDRLGLTVWEKKAKKVPARQKKQKKKKVVAEKPKKAKETKKAEAKEEVKPAAEEKSVEDLVEGKPKAEPVSETTEKKE